MAVWMARIWGLTAAVFLVLAVSVATGGEQPVAVNQTEGFGAGQLLVFTYLQNFACIHEPFDDLDHNGQVAAVDPHEFQRPICTVGHQSTIGPTGDSIDKVEKLWVIVPFFETNGHEPAFSEDLGEFLKRTFGFIPDAFKRHPGVPVQCPEPGPPETTHKGRPGTCTMHTTQLDLGPALAKGGLVPANTLVIVPTLNHSHIIDDDDVHTQGAIWWQIISVLVTDPRAWPTEDGTAGINSLAALREAQAAGQAAPDAPTNFFLFFSSDISSESVERRH
jgi:hypothetical protein